MYLREVGVLALALFCVMLMCPTLTTAERGRSLQKVLRKKRGIRIRIRIDIELRRRRRAIEDDDEEQLEENNSFDIDEKKNTIQDIVTSGGKTETVLLDYNRGIMMVTSPEKRTCNLHDIPSHMADTKVSEVAEALNLINEQYKGKSYKVSYHKDHTMTFKVDKRPIDVTDVGDPIVGFCQDRRYSMQWMAPFDDSDIASASEECPEQWQCNWLYLGAWKEREYCCDATWYECQKNCTQKTWLPVTRFKCDWKRTC